MMSRFTGRHLAVCATILALLLLFWPVLPALNSRMVGDFQSEIYTHAPPLAAALTGLDEHGLFVRADHPAMPGVASAASLEPITIVLMLPGYCLLQGTAGFALGWNLWLVLVLVGSAWGAWLGAKALLQEQDREEWGAGLCVALTVSSLFLHRFSDAGRTEAQNYPLYMLHLGLLLRAGLQKHDLKAWGLTAISMLPILWSGGYGAAFFAITEPFIALWLIVVSPARKQTLLGLVACVGAAGLLVAPLQLALKRFPYVGTGIRTEAHRIPSIDMALLFTDSFERVKDLPGYEVTPFAGWSLMGLALLGAALWPRARVFLAIALLCLWGAAGPEPLLEGKLLWGPTSLWSQLGPLSVLRGWCRLVAFAIPFFALAAAVVGARWRGLAILGAACTLGETACRAERHSWSLEGDFSEAGVLLLPLDTWSLTRRWLEGPEEPDAWKLSPERPLLSWLIEKVPVEPERFQSKTRSAAPDADFCTLHNDAVLLHSDGFKSIEIRSDAITQELSEQLGLALIPYLGEPVQSHWELPTEAGSCAGQPPALRTSAQNRGGTPAERKAAREAERAAREAERRSHQK
jgi:hypothetical protein